MRPLCGESLIFICRCMFKVLHLTLPLNDFQYALLKRFNVAPSQLHLNSWAMAKALEIFYPFFNIQPNMAMFIYFFQDKADKEDWVDVFEVLEHLL